MQKAKSNLYLVDASSYIYRAFHALPPLTSPGGLPTNALLGFTTMLLKLQRAKSPEYLAAVFDARGPTFRKELFPGYKAQRPPMPTDLATQIPIVHEIVAALGFADIAVEGVEADDVIATITENARLAGFKVVVVTSDKDLMQVVDEDVLVWDTMRDRWFDSAAVYERFGVAPGQIADLLGLMGDSVDNIPGVKGIGEKTATKLIQRFGSIESVLDNLDQVSSFLEIRSSKKVAELLRDQAEQARLSRQLAVVRRDVDVGCSLEDLRVRSVGPESLRPIFARLGFQRLLKETSSSGSAISVSSEEIRDEHSWAEFLHRAHCSGRVAIAIHTDQPNSRIAMCGLEDGVIYSLSSAINVAERLLLDPTIEKVGHDLKTDLRASGQVTPRIENCFDVMVASYLLEASPSHRLEDLSADIQGVNLPVFRGQPGDLAAGVSRLLELRNAFVPQLRERNLERLFADVEMPLIGVLARMERNGMQINVGHLAELGQEMTSRMTVLMQEVFELAGGEFNIGSPQQLREVLFDRLQLSTRGVKRGKTGLSTDVDVLTRLSDDHPLPSKILEYRALAKLKSTYVDALPAAVDPETGRLHTTFNQTVAATGRLSSSDPNLQNIPIRGAEGQRIRAAFVAPTGRRLLVADYSQIELRILAHLSGDAALIEAFSADDDIHLRTAAEVFGVLPGMVSRDMRRVAKVINFGIVYGMGSQALARELSIPVAKAVEYIENYFCRYVGVKEYIRATVQDAHEKGYVTTILGRRRTLPALASKDRNTAQAAERTATNTPIQGSAADLIKLAMVRIDQRLTAEKADAFMMLQVHDELVLEVGEDAVDSVSELVRQEMESAMHLRVPLKVHLGIGGNWAAAH